MVTVTESSGVVSVNGRDKYSVAVCSKCGACVTMTIKQDVDGKNWLSRMDENIPCCDEPYYFWGDWKHYHQQSGG